MGYCFEIPGVSLIDSLGFFLIKSAKPVESIESLPHF